MKINKQMPCELKTKCVCQGEEHRASWRAETCSGAISYKGRRQGVGPHRRLEGFSAWTRPSLVLTSLGRAGGSVTPQGRAALGHMYHGTREPG